MNDFDARSAWGIHPMAPRPFPIYFYGWKAINSVAGKVTKVTYDFSGNNFNRSWRAALAGQHLHSHGREDQADTQCCRGNMRGRMALICQTQFSGRV